MAFTQTIFFCAPKSFSAVDSLNWGFNHNSIIRHSCVTFSQYRKASAAVSFSSQYNVSPLPCSNLTNQPVHNMYCPIGILMRNTYSITTLLSKQVVRLFA